MSLSKKLTEFWCESKAKLLSIVTSMSNIDMKFNLIQINKIDWVYMLGIAVSDKNFVPIR